jgi:signal transduction histidine kinase
MAPSPSPSRSSGRTQRSLGALILLALALVLVAVLAYQAQDAARSHQKTAERTLKEYASFASWQLTQQAKNSLLTNVISSLVIQASAVNPDSLEQTLLSPHDIGRVATEVASFCRCLDRVNYFFRYDWFDGTFRTTDTELPDAELAWARDTMVAYVRAMPSVEKRAPITFGSADGRYGQFRELAVILTNDSYAMVFGEWRGVQRLLVFVALRDRRGTPLAVYGYEAPPSSFVTPALSQIHEKYPLLPESWVGGHWPPSVVAIAVTDATGHDVYRSVGRFTSPFSALDTLGSPFGGLVTRVSLRPEIAGQLIVGGLPRSRLPILIGLFALTAGLLGVALVQMRRQAELARLRTEFVSGVSHELRTPLAQIRWFAELLRMGKLRSEEERQRSASIIDQEARRLTYLVENVLNFSRSEKGANRISPTEVDLAHEVRDVLEIFAPLARSRRVTLRSELEPGLTANADRDALRQVLLNLLDNAAKYGPVGQTVTVGTSAHGDTVRLWVEDQGPGIPIGDRDRVWDAYVRLTRKAEEATGGSGIGLSVVRELIAMHGGRTWIESGTDGIGARIIVELPGVEADAHELPLTPGTTPANAPTRATVLTPDP